MIGLPPEEDRIRLARVYLTEQRAHWPELAKSGLLPEPTDEMCRSLSDRFRDRQASGEISELPKVLQTFKRSAAYLRFSCDNSNPKSLDDQLSQILTRAARDRELIPWAWVFADSGVSGRTPRRGSYAALKTLLRDQKQPVSTVFIDDFSRAGRQMLEWLRLAHLVSQFGAGRIVGVTENFDSSSPQSKMMMNIYGTFCEYFLDQLSAKVLRGMRGAAGRGTTTGKPPLGYIAVPEVDREGRPVLQADGTVQTRPEIDPQTRLLVERVFGDFLSGKSSTAIARELNIEQALGRRNWRAGRVAKILTRGAYVGVWRYNTTRTLLDPETGTIRKATNLRSEWIVQRRPELRIVSWRQLRAARRKLRQHRWGGRSRNYRYPTTLLSGCLFCGDCGRELTLNRSCGKYQQFACLNGSEGIDGCAQRGSKSVNLIERHLLAFLREEFFAKLPVEEIAAEASRVLTEEAARPRGDTAAITERLKDVQDRFKRLVSLAESEDADMPELKARLKTLREERAALQRELDLATRNLPTGIITPGRVRQILADLQGLLRQDIASSAPLIRKLLGEVSVRQAPNPLRQRSSKWLLRFTPAFSEVVRELSLARNYPDQALLEYLSRLIWTKVPEQLVEVSLKAKFRQVQPEVVRRLKAGEGPAKVQAALGLTPNGVYDAWRSAHANGDPNGEAPPVPKRPPKKVLLRDEAVRLYHTSGLTTDQVGAQLGVSGGTVELAHRKWHELHPDMPGSVPSEFCCRCVRGYSPDLRRRVVECLRSGQTCPDVARALGVTPHIVRMIQTSWAAYQRRKRVGQL